MINRHYSAYVCDAFLCSSVAYFKGDRAARAAGWSIFRVSHTCYCRYHTRIRAHRYPTPEVCSPD